MALAHVAAAKTCGDRLRDDRRRMDRMDPAHWSASMILGRRTSSRSCCLRGVTIGLHHRSARHPPKRIMRPSSLASATSMAATTVQALAIIARNILAGLLSKPPFARAALRASRSHSTGGTARSAKPHRVTQETHRSHDPVSLPSHSVQSAAAAGCFRRQMRCHLPTPIQRSGCWEPAQNVVQFACLVAVGGAACPART